MLLGKTRRRRGLALYNSRMNFVAFRADRLACEPIMCDIPHQEGTVELHRSWRKNVMVLEEARFHSGNIQRLDMPGHAPEFNPVESARLRGWRVAQ